MTKFMLRIKKARRQGPTCHPGFMPPAAISRVRQAGVALFRLAAFFRDRVSACLQAKQLRFAQSSKATSASGDVLRPIFSNGGPIEMPGLSVSTMKQLNDAQLASLLVCAKINNKLASGALEMNVFVPLMI